MCAVTNMAVFAVSSSSSSSSSYYYYYYYHPPPPPPPHHHHHHHRLHHHHHHHHNHHHLRRLYLNPPKIQLCVILCLPYIVGSYSSTNITAKILCTFHTVSSELCVYHSTNS